MSVVSLSASHDEAPSAVPTSRLAADLGELLRTAREAQGLSRRELARSIPSGHPFARTQGASIADTSLWELESGRSNPTLRKVEEMAAAYGLDVEIAMRRRRRPPRSA